MTKWNFFFVSFFIAILAELFLGSWGIIFPVSALLLFYLTVTYGWRQGIICACICGLFIDVLFGRQYITTPLTLASIIFIALFWYHYVETQSLFLHFIPGGILAILYLTPSIISQIIQNDFNLNIIWNNTANLIFGTLACSVILPMVIVVLDSISAPLELELYSEAKTRNSGRT